MYREDKDTDESDSKGDCGSPWRCMMMGFSQERDGVFAPDDDDFSQSFDDPEQRDGPDFDRWNSVLKMWVCQRGLSKLIARDSASA